MFRIIGSSIIVLGLLLGASQAAEAHGTARHGYDTYGYQYGGFHRNRHMPRWLWNKRGFRHWYFRTPLRFNRHLTWRELHSAFRWERRHSFRRHYRAPYGARWYDNDRRWRDNDRRWHDDDRRDRRPGPRRRHRDG